MARDFYISVISGEKKGAVALVVRFVLSILAALYQAGLHIRWLLYALRIRRRRSVGAPVVSIGNITTGGTGKTPFVEYLARLTCEAGKKPVILSRGYHAPADGYSDEYLLLKENIPNVPHYTDANRLRAAQLAIKEKNPDIFILDDGFQHYQMRRDLDIVLIDGLNPFGYGRLLPRGLLREPVTALRRAGMFVITRTEQTPPKTIEAITEYLNQMNPSALVLRAAHKPLCLEDVYTKARRDVADLKGKKVVAFCGLGNPRPFFAMLHHLGAIVIFEQEFRDHIIYPEKVLELLEKAARTFDAKWLLTTQKDAVKLRERKFKPQCYALLIKVELEQDKDTLKKEITAINRDVL